MEGDYPIMHQGEQGTKSQTTIDLHNLCHGALDDSIHYLFWELEDAALCKFEPSSRPTWTCFSVNGPMRLRSNLLALMLASKVFKRQMLPVPKIHIALPPL